jgi:hypothetical protein
LPDSGVHNRSLQRLSGLADLDPALTARPQQIDQGLTGLRDQTAVGDRARRPSRRRSVPRAR